MTSRKGTLGPEDFIVEAMVNHMLEALGFGEVARSRDSVRETTNSSFRGGLNPILDMCDSLAKSSK